MSAEPTAHEPTAVKAASPAVQTPLDPLAAPVADAAEAASEPASTFRVGDYEVGDGYFSELSGHPDIVY